MLLRGRGLRNSAGWVAANVLRYSGRIDRTHSAISASQAVLSIYFHNPGRKLFSRIVGWLSDKGYRFLSCEDVLGFIDSAEPFPTGSAFISFDDAWRDNLTEVIPLVMESDLPVTIFVATAEVQRGFYWFSQAQKHSALLPEPYRSDVRRLWKIPEPTRRAVVDQLFHKTQTPAREVMTVEEVAEIAKLPQVTIGSHSVNHAILPNCDDQLLCDEVTGSKQQLETWTGRPVRFFSYPNGDFDVRTSSVLAEAGYQLGFTTENRVMRVSDPRFYLPRFSVMDDGSFTENLCHALGLWTPVVEGFKRAIRRIS